MGIPRVHDASCNEEKKPFHLATDLPKTATFKPKQGRHYAMCRVPWGIPTIQVLRRTLQERCSG